MNDSPAPSVPRSMRVVTIVAVAVVAAVSAVVSYVHMRELAEDAGEEWRAILIPLSVDGLLIAASMVMLVRRLSGRRAGALAWLSFGLGMLASLGANVARAETTDPVKLIVSGWPPVALALAFELLILMVREGRSAQSQTTTETTEAPAVQASTETTGTTEIQAVPTTIETGPETTSDPGPDHAETVSVHLVPTTVPARSETTRPRTRTAGRTAAAKRTGPAVEEVRAWVEEQSGPVSQRAVRNRFGVGNDTARDLLAAVQTTGSDHPGSTGPDHPDQAGSDHPEEELCSTGS